MITTYLNKWLGIKQPQSQPQGLTAYKYYHERAVEASKQFFRGEISRQKFENITELVYLARDGLP